MPSWRSKEKRSTEVEIKRVVEINRFEGVMVLVLKGGGERELRRTANDLRRTKTRGEAIELNKGGARAAKTQAWGERAL